MTENAKGSQMPRLRITDIRLLSLYYRVGRTEPAAFDQMASMIQGNIKYSYSAKKKNSFKMRSNQEVKLGDVLFRARHEARFTSDTPVSKELFDDETFQRVTINMLLPFGSELFANLSGKTFTSPIITPSGLSGDEWENG